MDKWPSKKYFQWWPLPYGWRWSEPSEKAPAAETKRYFVIIKKNKKRGKNGRKQKR